MKIESCPKCGRAPTEFPSATAGRVKANIACMGEFADFWFHHGVQAKTEKAATRKWNRWARRERRRMKKEAGK